VDYEKLDADLHAELSGVAADSNAAPLPIFIKTDHPPDADQQSFLKQLGVTGEVSGRDLFTATLSHEAIAELSCQPWVRYLKLSRTLRPLSGAD
jgi:hypothetical protein